MMRTKSWAQENNGRPPLLDFEEERKLRERFVRYRASVSDFLREFSLSRSTFYRYQKRWQVPTVRVGIDEAIGHSSYSRHLQRPAKNPRIAYDIAFANLISKTLGVRVQLVPIDPSRAIERIQEEQVAMVISRLGDTCERKRHVQFSPSYLPPRKAPMRILARPSLSFHGARPRDWQKTKFAVQENGVNARFLAGSHHLIKNFKNEEQTIAALSSGQVDALLIDKDHFAETLFSSHQNKTFELKPLKIDYGFVPCIAFNKSETHLLDSVSRIVEKAQASGLTEKLYREFHS